MPYFTVCGLISLCLLLYAQPQCVDCISVHVYVQHTFYSLHYVYLSYFHHQQKQVVCCYVLLWKLTLRKPSRDHINLFQPYFFSNLCILITVFNRILAMYGGKYANEDICQYWTMNKIHTSNLNATPPTMTFMVRKLIISGGWREILGCYSIIPIPTRNIFVISLSHPRPNIIIPLFRWKITVIYFL